MGTLRSMEIASLFSKEYKKDYLKKLKINHEQTLFPMNWDALKEDRCPYCSNRLYCRRDNDMMFCKGKKHLKRFTIKKTTLERIKNEINNQRGSQTENQSDPVVVS